MLKKLIPKKTFEIKTQHFGEKLLDQNNAKHIFQAFKTMKQLCRLINRSKKDVYSPICNVSINIIVVTENLLNTKCLFLTYTFSVFFFRKCSVFIPFIGLS